jgi:intracellular sulfur oxidation DsrE/DsrF family protein
MKCPEAHRLLDAYVDDELEAAGVLALEDHLRECARCRAREASRRALREVVQRNTEYCIAPAALRVDLRTKLGSVSAPPAARARWRVAAGLAALVLVAGIAGWQAGGERASMQLARAPKAESKVIYHISDSRTASAALRTLRNHLEASPRTKVVVVTHNEGVNFLLRGARDESGQLFEDRVHQFRLRGVDFRVCTNTLVRRRIEAQGVVSEATLVPSGIAEIGRLQESEGYTYMRM